MSLEFMNITIKEMGGVELPIYGPVTFVRVDFGKVDIRSRGVASFVESVMEAFSPPHSKFLFLSYLQHTSEEGTNQGGFLIRGTLSKRDFGPVIEVLKKKDSIFLAVQI